MLVYACPSFLSSGVYVLFIVFCLGRLATTRILDCPALEEASRQQAAAH